MCKRNAKKNKKTHNLNNNNKGSPSSSDSGSPGIQSPPLVQRPPITMEEGERIVAKILEEARLEKEAQGSQSSLETRMSSLKVEDSATRGHSWIYEDFDIVTINGQDLEDLKTQLEVKTKSEESLKQKLLESQNSEEELKKANNELREIALLCVGKLTESQEQYQNVVNVLATVTEHLPQTQPAHLTGDPIQNLRAYRELKASLQDGDVLNQGRMMLQRLMTMTTKSSIQTQAIAEVAAFFTSHKNYLMALDHNIFHIEKTGNMNTCVPIPEYPKLSKELRDEYWKEMDLVLKSSASRPIACSHCHRKLPSVGKL